MKTLASRLALTLLAIALSSPAMAQEVSPAKTTCKSTSTSGKCLLALINALQSQVSDLSTALTTANTNISTLQTALTTANSNISALQSSNTTLTSEVSTLQTALTAANSNISTLQSSNSTLTSQVTALQSSDTTLTSEVSTLQTALSTANSSISALQTALTTVQNNNALALGPYVSVLSGAVNGLNGPHVIFSGANVHIESGSGNTVDTTGLGNLVIGYDEDSLDSSVIDGNRTGSHNLVVGPQHEFTASGGVVSGYANFTSANYASVTGGECNAAGSASFPAACTYSGGASDGAGVSGGASNTASGEFSSVSGGFLNAASGVYSTASGGTSNAASSEYSSVSGGQNNAASGAGSSVSGGQNNTASADFSSILGGDGITVSTEWGTSP